MKCQIDQCGHHAAGIRVFERRPDGTLYHPFVCEGHALAIIRRYTSECADTRMPSKDLVPLSFSLACVAICDSVDVAIVYLKAADGACVHITTGKLEARMLANLLLRSVSENKAAPHEALGAIVDGFGGSVREVVIEEPTSGDFCASLQILQSGHLVSIAMRASDGVAFTLAKGVPLRVEPGLVARSAHRATESDVLEELRRGGSTLGDE